MTTQPLRRADELLSELAELVETARAVPMSGSPAAAITPEVGRSCLGCQRNRAVDWPRIGVSASVAARQFSGSVVCWNGTKPPVESWVV
jgi:hypothetical protein